MAAAAILYVWKVPIVDPDDLHVHVIPLFGMCEGGNPFLELFFAHCVKVKVKSEATCKIGHLTTNPPGGTAGALHGSFQSEPTSASNESSVCQRVEGLVCCSKISSAARCHLAITSPPKQNLSRSSERASKHSKTDWWRAPATSQRDWWCSDR